MYKGQNHDWKADLSCIKFHDHNYYAVKPPQEKRKTE